MPTEGRSVIVIGYPGAEFRGRVLRVYAHTTTTRKIFEPGCSKESVSRVQVIYEDGYVNDLQAEEVRDVESDDLTPIHESATTTTSENQS